MNFLEKEIVCDEWTLAEGRKERERKRWKTGTSQENIAQSIRLPCSCFPTKNITSPVIDSIYSYKIGHSPSYPCPYPYTIHTNTEIHAHQTISLLVFRRLSLRLGLLLKRSNLPSPTPSLPIRDEVSLSLTTSASPFFPFFSIFSSSGSIKR